MTNFDWELISSVPGWLYDSEALWLANVASNCDSWTEIGTYAGRSTLAAALNLKIKGLLQVVDIEFQEQFFRTLRLIHNARPDLTIIICEKDSKIAYKYLNNTDVVFIDGDHSYEGVCSDIYNWRSKGLLCGHDYEVERPTVVCAVKELVDNFKNPVDTIWAQEELC